MEELKPNGNCLGVALIDAWSMSGLPRPEIALAELATPHDAVRALSHNRLPSLLMPENPGLIARLGIWLAARRLGLPLRHRNSLAAGEVILCARSMRQLYGISFSQAHWVVIGYAGGQPELRDRLWPEVSSMFGHAVAVPGNVVLDQIGPSLVV